MVQETAHSERCREIGEAMKLKLPPGLIGLAYRVFDVEASGRVATISSRTIEYGFALSRLTRMPRGRVLDVGCTARVNPIPATLAELGWEVWGVDLRAFEYRHANFRFVKGDLEGDIFEAGYFDAVCAVSTIEHFGLGGRYGISREELDKDARAVGQIRRIVKPHGAFLVTVPLAAQARIDRPMQRVYDEPALNALFSGWLIKSRRYYAKAKDGVWQELTEGHTEGIDNADGESAVALLELTPGGEEPDERRRTPSPSHHD